MNQSLTVESVIKDILLVTIPAVLVLVTAYILLRQYFDKQYKQELLKHRFDIKKETLKFKLQAYERLALFLDRISFPNLILRIRSSNMGAKTLNMALLVAIQQEYEHNSSQQVYTSENLWNIIKLARQEMANLIAQTYTEMGYDDNADVYVEKLLKAYMEWELNPVEQAISAIKQEASLIL